MRLLKKSIKPAGQYVIGVDGGGTKTIAALANLEAKVLTYGYSGSSSPRNVGIKKAAQNVAEAIRSTLKRIAKKSVIAAVFVGLPAVEEEFKLKKEKIKKELLKQRGVFPITKSKIIIGSDQITAFRSGTGEKDGVLVIAGTGHVAHGWRHGKEAHANGWGWLADEGSAFWVGHQAIKAVFKDLDGRGEKTLITKLVSKKFSLRLEAFFSDKEEIKNRGKLLFKIYPQNLTEILASLSILVDEAAKKGDRVAKDILVEAGRELALAAKTAIRKLNFQQDKFPLVLVGGVFKSKLVLQEFKKEVKKFAPQAEFILPKTNPVIGAVKLAIEKCLN